MNSPKLASATWLPHRLVHPRGDRKHAEAAENGRDIDATYAGDAGKKRVGSEWLVVGGGALLRVDEDGAFRFGPGQGRPWGRVAWVHLRSKVKDSEWWIFGVEWLLGAVNGDEPK